MAPESLNDAEYREVRQVAKIEVREYFDHYLQNIWPQQQAELEKHCQKRVEQHNHSPQAHGGVERKVNRFTWTLIGVCLASGASGLGLARLMMMLGG